MAINMIVFELKEFEKQFFKENSFEDLNITFFEEALNEKFISGLSEELLEKTNVISIVRDSSIPSEVLEKFKNLRVISIRGRIYDNICVTGCEDKNIAVVNVESAGVLSEAQFIIGLIISLVRKINISDKIDKVSEDYNNDFIGRDLTKLTLGIVGTGLIGAEVCRLANAIGMKIVLCDSSEKQELREKYSVEYKSLDELAQCSDIVSINIDYSPENYHMCDDEFFSKCRDGFYFINTSKSEIIDYEALDKNLENCKIQGAAIDVTPCKYICPNCKDLSRNMEPEYLECLAQTDYINRFKKYNNVIITPHIAGLTQDSINYVLRETIYNVKEALKGEKMCRVI